MFTEGDDPKDPTVEELLAQIGDLKEKMVPKEQLEKLMEDNKKLIKQITEDRPRAEAPKDVTSKDIIKRIEERTEKIANSSTSYDAVRLTLENHRDMQKLGLDVSHVDENIVQGLEKIVADSNGDPMLFKAHMESRIKNK